MPEEILRVTSAADQASRRFPSYSPERESKNKCHAFHRTVHTYPVAFLFVHRVEKAFHFIVLLFQIIRGLLHRFVGFFQLIHIGEEILK